MAKVVDVTQREEGDEDDWVDEPISERDPSLLVHTARPFNAEPQNGDLIPMYTPKGSHYRRTHTPVPVVDEQTYYVSVGLEDGDFTKFSMETLRRTHTPVPVVDEQTYEVS